MVQCPVCFTENSQDFVFCQRCGASLKASAPPAFLSPPQALQPAPTPWPPQQQIPQGQPAPWQPQQPMMQAQPLLVGAPPMQQPMLPQSLMGAFMLRPGEFVDAAYYAVYSLYSNGGMTQVGRTMSGILILTSQRLLLIEQKGVFNKAFALGREIGLERVTSCSITGGVGNSGNMNMGRSISSLKINDAQGGMEWIHIFGQLSFFDTRTMQPGQQLDETSKQAFAERVRRMMDERVKVAGEQKAEVAPAMDFPTLKSEIEKGGVILTTIKCPACNANLDLPPSGTNVQCQNCGSAVRAQDIYEKMKGFISGLR